MGCWIALAALVAILGFTELTAKEPVKGDRASQVERGTEEAGH